MVTASIARTPTGEGVFHIEAEVLGEFHEPVQVCLESITLREGCIIARTFGDLSYQFNRFIIFRNSCIHRLMIKQSAGEVKGNLSLGVVGKMQLL